VPQRNEVSGPMRTGGPDDRVPQPPQSVTGTPLNLRAELIPPARRSPRLRRSWLPPSRNPQARQRGLLTHRAPRPSRTASAAGTRGKAAGPGTAPRGSPRCYAPGHPEGTGRSRARCVCPSSWASPASRSPPGKQHGEAPDLSARDTSPWCAPPSLGRVWGSPVVIPPVGRIKPSVDCSPSYGLLRCVRALTPTAEATSVSDRPVGSSNLDAPTFPSPGFACVAVFRAARRVPPGASYAPLAPLTAPAHCTRPGTASSPAPIAYRSAECSDSTPGRTSDTAARMSARAPQPSPRLPVAGPRLNTSSVLSPLALLSFLGLSEAPFGVPGTLAPCRPSRRVTRLLRPAARPSLGPSVRRFRRRDPQEEGRRRLVLLGGCVNVVLRRL